EKKQNDLSSFRKAKEAFFDKLWQAVPRRLRFPLVVLIVIGGGLVASHSYWYPALDAWLHPATQRFALGGRVLAEKDKGLPNVDVQLLNRNNKIVSNNATDDAGYVTFNLSTVQKI